MFKLDKIGTTWLKVLDLQSAKFWYHTNSMCNYHSTYTIIRSKWCGNHQAVDDFFYLFLNTKTTSAGSF